MIYPPFCRWKTVEWLYIFLSLPVSSLLPLSSFLSLLFAWFILFYITDFPQIPGLLFILKSKALKSWLAAVWRVWTKQGDDFFIWGPIPVSVSVCPSLWTTPFPHLQNPSIFGWGRTSSLSGCPDPAGKGPYSLWVALLSEDLEYQCLLSAESVVTRLPSS